MQSFLMLQQVVHITTAAFKTLRSMIWYRILKKGHKLWTAKNENTSGLYQLRYTAPNVAPDDGLKSPKQVEHLMMNKDTL